MATGGTSGQGQGERRVISSGGGAQRRRPEGEAPAAGAEAAAETNLVGDVDPALERLIAEEEEIERRTREHHEAPHFKKDE